VGRETDVMANTFSQIYIQAVFAVEGRQSLIRKENKEELYNREKHHARTSFRHEYLSFLKKFEVKFDPKYLFEFGNEGSREAKP
jgi:hypothetical protein